MKGKALVVIAFMLVASIAVFGQANLTGKWQTDNVPAALEAQKNAPPAEPGARGGRGGGGGGQAIIMDLKADASGKITGTVTEIGNPPELMIESGMITGKMITWVTQPRGVTWNLEMTDDNTLSLTGRVIGNRGGGGGGGRGQVQEQVLALAVAAARLRLVAHPPGTAPHAEPAVVVVVVTRPWPSATHCSASCEVNQISHKKAQKAQNLRQEFCPLLVPFCG